MTSSFPRSCNWPRSRHALFRQIFCMSVSRAEGACLKHIHRSQAKIPSYIPHLNGKATTSDDVNARPRQIRRPTRLTVIFTYYTHSIFCRVGAACILHVAEQCLQDQTSACLFFVRGQGNCNSNALG